MVKIKKSAEHFHRQGNFELAKTQYTKYLKENPNDPEVYHAFGVLLAQMHDHQNAMEKINRAIQLNPNQSSFYNSLGNVFLALKKNDAAKNAYKKAIRINSKYAVAYNNLGNVYYHQNQFVSAEKSYQKALELNPHYTDAQNNLNILLKKMGITFFENQHYEQAISLFERILSTDDKIPEMNYLVASTYLELGEHSKALNYYFRQLAQKPLFEAYYNIGVILMGQDKLNDAIEYFKKSLEYNPNDLSTQLNLGSIYLKQNKLDQAILIYQNANRIKPNDPEIQYILLALTQQYLPQKAPEVYLKNLFNQYAKNYDKHLVEILKYDAPKIIFEKINLEFAPAQKSLVILDLGCGTGLAGDYFKIFSKKLIGLDIAENMIAVARLKNIYDELITGEIESSIQQFKEIDLVIAADVFTYIGNLEFIFKQINQVLSNSGVFIFTIEQTFENDFILQSSIRYAHSKIYINKLAATYGFKIIALDNIVIRKQRNAPVFGYLALLKK
ncbi:MAG: hypothetical protein ACD_29C00469G0001 [uncultured bacterium]|nr:MAG: hypothetical protein ACD_29C00469G0001 [uncultured bacterium]